MVVVWRWLPLLSSSSGSGTGPSGSSSSSSGGGDMVSSLTPTTIRSSIRLLLAVIATALLMSLVAELREGGAMMAAPLGGEVRYTPLLHQTSATRTGSSEQQSSVVGEGVADGQQLQGLAGGGRKRRRQDNKAVIHATMDPPPPPPPPKKAIVLTERTLPPYVYKDTPIGGLHLFGAYWKAPGNKIVFSGQCFNQHHSPDYCAVYAKSNRTLCASEGTTRQMAGGIVECFLEDKDYDCPVEQVGGTLMAVVGRRDDETAHRIELTDYRRPSAQTAGHKLSMCVIFKAQVGDAELSRQRFMEWFAYHELVGFQHFYLYDHRSDQDKMDALKPVFDYYTAQGKLTLRRVDFSERCGVGETSSETTHEWVYSDCSGRYSDLDTWMAFPDNDEYIYPGDNHETVTEYLSSAIESDPGKENVLAINMPWYLFGTSGHKSRPAGTIIENYIKAEPPRCFTGKDNYWENYCTGKVLGRLDRMGYLIFPHLVDFDNSHGKWGTHTHPDWWSDPDLVNKDRDRVLFNRPEPSNRYCQEEGRPLCMWNPEVGTGLAVWHYFTQSEQDWREKMSRGCVIGCHYTIDKMREHDDKATLTETRMRDRFGARVRAIMAHVTEEMEQQQQTRLMRGEGGGEQATAGQQAKEQQQ